MGQLNLFAVVGGKLQTRTCTQCPLGLQPGLNSNCMKGVGAKQPLLMFVGGAPGTEDDARGLPWVGPTGRLLDELLHEAGIKRNEIFLTNAVRCAPGNGKAKAGHFKKCRPHLEDEIEAIQPQAIVSVGAEAVGWLTGFTKVSQVRRRSLPCKLVPGLRVYPIIQPAALFHLEGSMRAKARKQMIEDLEWIKRDVLNGPKKPKLILDYRVAKTLDDVDNFLSELDAVDEFAFDVETRSASEKAWHRPYKSRGDQLVAIGFSGAPGHARAIPLMAKAVDRPTYWPEGDVSKILTRVGNRLKGSRAYGFNAVLFDSMWTEEFMGAVPDISFDAQMAAYLIDENPPLNLESLAIRYTEMDGWKSGFNLDDPKQLASYLWQDCDATSRLRSVLEPQLSGKQRDIMRNLLMPLAWTLREMEQRGCRIDLAKLEALREPLEARHKAGLERLRSFDQVRAWEVANNTYFNPGSGKQLADVMENYFGFARLKDTDSGGYSTDHEVLDLLRDEPFCDALIDYRGVDKLLGTYIDGTEAKMSPGSLIHTSYGMLTVTGRLTSASPNLQNLPRKDEDVKAEFPIKNIFVPRLEEGYVFLQADYKQAELKVLACLSGDEKLLNIYRSGLDAHRATAAEIYKVKLEEVTDAQRNDAKRTNFGIVYGMGEESLVGRALEAARKKARKTKTKLSRKEKRAIEDSARAFYLLHQKTFKGVWAWLRKQERIIEKTGTQVTQTGRKRHHGKNDARARRQGYNFPIQSLASDITQKALIRIARVLKELGYGAYPLLTVHDSILFEVKQEQLWEVAAVVKDVMEGIKEEWLSLKMEVDLEAGISWGEMLKMNMTTLDFEEAK